MTDQVDAVDLFATFPLLGPETAEHILNRLPEETVSALRGFLSVDRGRSGAGLAVGALFLGAGIGGGLVYILAKRALETKYSQIAEDEIGEMEEHYRAKARALESEAAKRPVEEIVRERGYSSTDEKPPMAVSPPDRVVEEAKETLKDARPDAAKVVKEPQEHAEVRNVFEEHADPPGMAWVHAEELKRRSPDIPYVIHYDERDEMEDYDVTTLTYFEGDDVLSNERDEPIPPEDRERLVGEKNLERFGHGSNDPNVVYIRNDVLELVYEVLKSPNSYAEEVHGFTHGAYSQGNLERMRAREREHFNDDD